ncbi:hypothetical protein SAY86_024678 [Trapa natans]|uniref:CCHC-type domain-containing protein n=1 Tax=Trapa natans TaxID=22666 RepID=A0AAN7MVB6_TRANT|nr:hypothetical protein SAY86_024678 [Trapa natans]
MVSKRQKLARKRYKEEHPEMFPKPEPTPPKDPDKKNKKKSLKVKRKKSVGGDSKRSVRKSLKTHPLRVPGMKPGDGCFICRASDHIAKLCPQKSQWEKNKICLFCRHRGHSLKHCPNKTGDSVDVKMCYNCGESGHSLAGCPQPIQGEGTKFASCFICKERGHLSKNCPRNTHGIYPKGGCCKVCGGVTHLAKDCPEKGRRSSAIFGIAEDEDRPRPQVTRFFSGDDLEDDFAMDTTSTDKKHKVSASAGHSSLKDGELKPKKKGPKVINFVG